MSMVRVGDVVDTVGRLMPQPGRVTKIADGNVEVTMPNGIKFVAEDGDISILCAADGRIASRFLARDGTPKCDSCASNYSVVDLLDVRPDPAALLLCLCGEPLDTAKSEGIWTTGGIACEYRTCAHCHSTRAWMPRDRTTEPVRLHTGGRLGFSASTPTLLDAIDATPERGDELRRGSNVLAVTVRTAKGEWIWKILGPTREG